jgi:hypothetical protein
MLFGEALWGKLQQRKVTDFWPGNFDGCEPGSNMVSSRSQNSFLHLVHIATAIIL